jgi:hypothetical protein
MQTGLTWLRRGTIGGTTEHGYKDSSFMKCWEVIEQLYN